MKCGHFFFSPAPSMLPFDGSTALLRNRPFSILPPRFSCIIGCPCPSRRPWLYWRGSEVTSCRGADPPQVLPAPGKKCTRKGLQGQTALILWASLCTHTRAHMDEASRRTRCGGERATLKGGTLEREREGEGDGLHQLPCMAAFLCSFHIYFQKHIFHCSFINLKVLLTCLWH